MSDWNKDLGISKKGWEGLTSAQRKRMLSLFNKSPEQKKRTRKIGSRKGGRSQKEGQEVGKKYTVTSKVTTQGDKAPTKFLESVIKHLKK
jgi:hypothetical protein|tara:strand:- start:1095 stop:1364 length:270 start_codon:yes stop_codon:yes gene_type:complete